MKPPPMLAAMQKAAEKPNPYAWRQEGAAYIFRPSPGLLATLTPQFGKWAMLVDVGGTTYRGVRDTLEEAFKATDRLLYEKDKDSWLKSLCALPIAPWAGKLEA